MGELDAVEGDVPKAVAQIKARPDGDLVVLRSGEIVQTLMKHDLIDTYMLLIHPPKTTTTGVVIATYQPA